MAKKTHRETQAAPPRHFVVTHIFII
ncbi:hypothetical protein C359_00002 [Cryptococcus neoformans Bt120]|nr:hypothetical protein C359_00002 [Cryptococcus neoformans var. grubii Bt120]